MNARDRESVSSIPNPVNSVNSLSCLRDSTGRLLLASKSRDDSAAVGSESLTHPVNRNAAVTGDYDRGLLHSAISVNAVMNASKTVKSEPTRPLCGMIAIVHRDLNCPSSSESDCIRSDLNKADLHNPGCSSVPAGIAVNAPLNVSSALSPLTNLAQSHSAYE